MSQALQMAGMLLSLAETGVRRDYPDDTQVRPFPRHARVREDGELVQSSPFGGAQVAFKLASAEDTILAKLGRFKRGGCVSERQWTDVIGVVQVRSERLDLLSARVGTAARRRGPARGSARRRRYASTSFGRPSARNAIDLIPEMSKRLRQRRFLQATLSSSRTM